MKFENTKVFNLEGAIRGMRNAKKSWDKADSCEKNQDEFMIGENDMHLATTLIKASLGGKTSGEKSDANNAHRKFLRDIFISVDITAPRYWWQEMATYKVGTNFNSTSTMHTLMSDNFFNSCVAMYNELENYKKESDSKNVDLYLDGLASLVEELKTKYKNTKDFKYQRLLKNIIPESYENTRTFTCNYEVVRNIYHQRKNHLLTEWSKDFCNWVKLLPYAKEFILN